MWGQVPVIAAVGLAVGRPPYEVGLASLTMMAFALAAMIITSQRLAAMTIAVGLLTAAFVLVDYMDGLPFSGAYFFLVLVAVSFYEDRLVLAVGVVGTAAYYLMAAADRTADQLLWAATHAGAVTAMALLLMAGWRLGATRDIDPSGVRFRASFEEAPIGMAVLKPSGEFLEANRALANLLGYEQGSLAGVNITSLVHPDDRAELGSAWEQIGNSATHVATEWMRWQTAMGHQVWGRVSFSLIPRTSEGPALVVLQIEDAGHAYEEQHRLEQLLRDRDEFVAAVGDEIRRPLEILIDLTPGADATAHAREVAAIVDDLVMSARATTAPVSVAGSSLDAGEICREVVALVPGSGEVSLEIDATDMWADPALTRHIVYNLVTNAVRYGGSSVAVRTIRSGPDTVIEVSDDGPEIPEAERVRLFNGDLRNGRPATTPASVGLGLTVGRYLARQMDGDIEYRRTAYGHNIFELRLPSEQFSELPGRISA